jgi:hypothetical protein
MNFCFVTIFRRYHPPLTSTRDDQHSLKSQIAMASILVGDGENEADDPLARTPQPGPPTGGFGALKPNPAARGRRDKIKFFDSADWASGRQPVDPNATGTEQFSAFTPSAIAASPSANSDGASPLTGD